MHDLYCVYIGRVPLAAAIRDERVRLTGTTPMVNGFHRWMLWSSFAAASRVSVARPVPAP
ncbi:hypothetical protein ACFPIJ_46040 [Dactylosporangium cerinum]|uniref:Uncharacterized protein n=1 Tax=Dactylosporangium cerinum TaxID=1434730 RepID=A0ABV9WCG6_9ACTN